VYYDESFMLIMASTVKRSMEVDREHIER